MTEIPNEPSDEQRRTLDILRTFLDKERRGLDALDAYLDAPGEETEAALLEVAPGEDGPWLVAFADALVEFPESAWHEILREIQDRASDPPPEVTPTQVAGNRTHHRRPPVRPPHRFTRPANVEAVEECQPGDAFDAYLDAPGEETKAALLRAAPGGDGLWLVGFADALRGRPRSAWHKVQGEAQGRASATPGPVVLPAPIDHRVRRRRRPTRWPSLRLTRPSAVTALVAAVAVAVAVVLVGALVIDPFSGQSPRHPVTGAIAVPAAWRLAGFIDQPAWQAGGSAAPLGFDAAVTCPNESTCYADKPGNSQGGTVVEVTTDGGSTWQASSLASGWRLTSGLSCPTAERCLASSYTGEQQGTSEAPTALRPAILITTNGGATWSAVPLPSGVGEVTNLACSSPVECVGTGYGPATAASSERSSAAVVTTDGGTSWTVVTLPGPFVSDSPGGLGCPTVQDCVLVGGTGFATTATGSSVARGTALYSTDGGRSWSTATVPSTVTRIRAVSCSDATHCVALGNGTSTGSGSLPYGQSEALTSTDGGQTWVLAGPIDPVPAFLTSISCPTTTDCWAAGSLIASRSGAIMVTHDAGDTWTTVQLPTAPPARQGNSGLQQLDTEDVSSVSCPTVSTCVALGTQASLNPAEQQVVLRSDAS